MRLIFQQTKQMRKKNTLKCWSLKTLPHWHCPQEPSWEVFYKLSEEGSGKTVTFLFKYLIELLTRALKSRKYVE
jgi:hypothetical protein